MFNENLVTFSDVEKFRHSSEAQSFAENWIAAQRQGSVASNYHLDLGVWSINFPLCALGIVMNLLDRIGEEDEVLAEAVALGPLDFLIETGGDSILPILRESIRVHTAMGICTKWKREHPDSATWQYLSEK